MSRPISKLAGLCQAADRELEGLVLLARKTKLLGNDPRLYRLVFLIKHMSQDDWLEFVGGFGGLFGDFLNFLVLPAAVLFFAYFIRRK